MTAETNEERSRRISNLSIFVTRRRTKTEARGDFRMRAVYFANLLGKPLGQIMLELDELKQKVMKLYEIF